MPGHNTGHKARKRFGQNFLHDRHVIERIIADLNPSPDDRIVEIGPGLGALTDMLLHRCGELHVIEIDRDLTGRLAERFGTDPRFNLYNRDVLKFDFRPLAKAGNGLRIIGNLPYNISTPLLFHLLQQDDCIRDMLFMLQLEVVQRMAAAPGDSNYGRLGIMVQYYCRVEKRFNVPPAAFHPQPKVDSAIVRLIPHGELPHPAKDVTTLERVVREAFSQRRKTLRNSLKNLVTDKQLAALGIDGARRAETLSLAEYVNISDSLD